MHARSRSRATLVGAGLPLAVGILHGEAGATIHRTAVGTSAGIPTVRVSHDRYPDHAEPALAVNPRDAHNLLGAAMDFDRSPTPGTFVSFDGGMTWHDNGALPLPTGFTQGGDVSVAFTPRGTGFVAAEALSGLNADVRGVYVWRTDDGGRTFQRPVAVVSGQFVDHPWLAGGTAPSPGSGALYVAWVTRPGVGRTQTEGLAFSRSLDGGHSFTAPR